MTLLNEKVQKFAADLGSGQHDELEEFAEIENNWSAAAPQMILNHRRHSDHRGLGLKIEQLGMKWLIAGPTIDPKITVQRQDFAGPQYGGKLDKARIGQVDVSVSIFADDLLDLTSRIGQAERNLEDACGYVVQDRFASSGNTAQEVNGLSDYSFAS